MLEDIIPPAGFGEEEKIWRGLFAFLFLFLLVCNLNLIDCKSFSRIAEREVFLFVTSSRFNRNCCNSVEVVLLDC